MQRNFIGAALLTLIAGYAAPVAAVLDLKLGLEAGYRIDSLDWNIASDISGTATPNILSELRWTDIMIGQIKANVDVALIEKLHLLGYASYGDSYTGDNQDSDFFCDNRFCEFSRSENEATAEVLDASLALGYQIDYKRRHKNPLHFMPLFGLSIHQQDLRMKNGVQTLDPFDLFTLGPFPGLNSSYDTEWKGWWIGVRIWEADTFRNLTLTFDLAYHNVEFEAEANWNLRTDFAHPKSFEQFADSEGVTLALNADYALTKHFSLTFGIDYKNWSTDPGIDRIFFSDGTIVTTRLNEVNWESWAFNGGVAFHF